MHFWIGHHRGHHQGHPHNNYLPSTYDSGLTSPPRPHGPGPTHQDSVVSTSGGPGGPHVDTASAGSVGVLKWAVLATIIFIVVFFVGTEIYKLHQESNYHMIIWMLGTVAVLLVLVLVACGIPRCRSKMRQDNPPADVHVTAPPTAFV